MDKVKNFLIMVVGFVIIVFMVGFVQALAGGETIGMAFNRGMSFVSFFLILPKAVINWILELL